MNKLPDIVLGSWGGGLYLDRWTGLHILAGCLLAFASRFLGLSPRGAVLLALGVLIGWEIVEHSLSVYEPLSNSAVDLVAGMAAFMFVFVLASRISITARYAVVIVLGVLFVWLSIVAWRSWYEYHAADENTLRTTHKAVK
jgi:hypothetical protein